MTTSTQIANRALEQIGAQATVSGLVPNLTGGSATAVGGNGSPGLLIVEF